MLWRLRTEIQMMHVRAAAARLCAREGDQEAQTKSEISLKHNTKKANSSHKNVEKSFLCSLSYTTLNYRSDNFIINKLRD